jgi:hypothetical protein
VALMDEDSQAAREETRRQWRQAVEEQNALDRELRAHVRMVQMLTTAVLLASGYHPHKRQWRVRRGRKENQ